MTLHGAYEFMNSVKLSATTWNNKLLQLAIQCNSCSCKKPMEYNQAIALISTYKGIDIKFPSFLYRDIRIIRKIAVSKYIP